jgi:phosphoglycerate dehydrogenase-like enzyme
MKSNSTFINTGRGAQVVEADLAKCLRKNQSLCALLDVTSREPLFPWSSLKRCMNAFITPHIAGSISNEICRMVDNMWESYCKVKGGKEAPYEVFKESLIKQA